jgi:hypothetical protein
MEMTVVVSALIIAIVFVVISASFSVIVCAGVTHASKASLLPDR